jgi:DNA-binding winged helix-turn-helix (wHTH) protein
MAVRYFLLDLDIDLDARTVRRAGCTVEVAGLSFDLLACLLVRGDAVVSFDELMTAVWAPSVVNEETITQRVKLLRQALGDDSRKPRYIRSVRGRGYQLLAQPRVISSASDTPRARAHTLADWKSVWLSLGTQWLDRAESLANVVLRAEPRNALAHTALGYAADCRGYIDLAISEYERALRLDPSGRREALGSVANLYQVKGRLIDALRSNLALRRSGERLRYLDIQTARTMELLGFADQAGCLYERSFRLYPDNLFSNAAWPQFLMTHGRVLEANSALDEALARGTDRNDLQLLAADLALQQGDRRAAAGFLARASAMRPASSFAATMALLYGGELPAPGVLRERIEAVQRSIQAGDRWPLNWLEIAVLENALGDRPAAIAALYDAVGAGFLDKAYLESSAFFRPLNSGADFARLSAEITRRVQDQRRGVLRSDWIGGELMVASR